MCRRSLRLLLDREGVLAALEAGWFNADRKFEIDIETMKRLVQEVDRRRAEKKDA